MQIQINPIYPYNENNKEGEMFRFLNESIDMLVESQGVVYILWTHTDKTDISFGWYPNHFVSLLANNSKAYSGNYIYMSGTER